MLGWVWGGLGGMGVRLVVGRGTGWREKEGEERRGQGVRTGGEEGVNWGCG